LQHTRLEEKKISHKFLKQKKIGEGENGWENEMGFHSLGLHNFLWRLKKKT